MKFVRLLVFSLLILFGVVMIISLFIPSHLRISRAKEIAAPADSIRSQLGDPRNWKNWYPDLDTIGIYYEGGVAKGVISANGDRRLLLTSVTDTAIITSYSVRDRKPVISGWSVIGDGRDGKPVIVQWYMDFRLGWYPWEKFASLVFEKTYGPMLEQGLARLQRVLQTGAHQTK